MYAWFVFLYKASYFATIIGYVLVMLEFMGVAHILMALFESEMVRIAH